MVVSNILEKLKTFIRTNKYLEIIAYLIQNNLFPKLLNSAGFGEFDTSMSGLLDRGEKIADLYAKSFDYKLKNKVVLEIGTGFSTAVALWLVQKYKVKKVFTYDYFNCLHENNELVENQSILSGSTKNINYFFGNAESIKKKISKNSIDFIVSNAVLEHVNNLEKLLINMLHVVKRDSKMFHVVDLRCHNRFKMHGELYFHTFHNLIWNLMGGRIGHPNRMLFKEYIKLFEKYNLENNVVFLQHFSKSSLDHAKMYLKSDNIDPYEISEFRVMSSLEEK